MSDFEDALKRGFDAFRFAEQARKEIAETLEELSAAVERFTDNKVVIRAARMETTTLVYPLAALVQSANQALSNQIPEREKPDALFALRRGAESGKRALLCRMTIGEDGYPVEVSVAGVFLHANDQASLRAALLRMLEHSEVAGKIAQVAQLRGGNHTGQNGPKALPPVGGSPAETTAEQAMQWLSRESESERRQGYRVVAEALQRQEDLHPSIAAILRGAALGSSRSYSERAEAMRLLHIADVLTPEERSRFALLWFSEPSLTKDFSSALSALFTLRADLPVLLSRLAQVPVPDVGTETEGTDIATMSHRLSQAFGSIRSALEHDGATAIPSAVRAQLEELRERFSGVPTLRPILGEIEKLTS